MKLRNYILVMAVVAHSTSAFAQAAYILPSPTAVDDEVTLFIDVNQTTGGLKAMLINHPERQDSGVYIWTWMPAEPVGGNGQWNDSNELRKMTHEGNLLYSISFVPSTYYGIDGPTFFANGISCLAKLDNGNDFPDDAVGEAKTEDLHIDIIPKLCDDLFCVFPQLAKSDDYVTITYDNSHETHPSMQNLGPDDAYIYLRIEQNPFNGFPYVEDQGTVVNTPALKLKPVAGEPGKYRITFIPSEFFDDLVPEGFDYNTIKFFVIRPGFAYPNSNLPFEVYTFLNCTN